MRVYLDNAATTPPDPEVVDAMLPWLQNFYGNPSSIHSHGREARSAIEKARKTVAGLINAAPSEVFFTSGGTEADNAALACSLEAHNTGHAITTRIEHHAVLHCLENQAARRPLQLHYLTLDSKGNFDYAELEQLLTEYKGALVSVMHGNNEIGNLSDIDRIAALCRETGACFHSDTVQTLGHYPIDCRQTDADFITGSAHKFHGPKGTGILFINSRRKIQPFIHGGSQERNMRGGTENVAGIVGLAKALELACTEQYEHRAHIEGLKSRMIARLHAQVEGVAFNGESGNLGSSLYTVLNVSLPPSETGDMLLFSLDINGVSASGGSACSSGSETGSHVLKALRTDPARGAVRFSFSKYNTNEEVDYAVEKLAELYTVGV